MAQNRDDLIKEVTRNGQSSLWDAHDQGRLAYHSGTPLTANPHGPLYPGYFHTNMAYWQEGWQREARALPSNASL